MVGCLAGPPIRLQKWYQILDRAIYGAPLEKVKKNQGYFFILESQEQILLESH